MQCSNILLKTKGKKLTNNRLRSTPSTFHELPLQFFHLFSSSSCDHLYENIEALFDQIGTENQLKNESQPKLSMIDSSMYEEYTELVLFRHNEVSMQMDKQ